MVRSLVAATITLALSLWSAPSVFGDDGTGLKISAAVDMVGNFKASKGSSAPDRFDVREAEILLFAPIDHVFDGVLSGAAHEESGVSMFEVHEAYIGSSKLIPRSRFRLGQFFLGVGRLNRFHRHEWPFVFAPTVQQKFFGGEGALDSGAEYSFLAPLPFFLELTAGVTNGWTYGHSHTEGEKPRQPTHYGRLATYTSLPWDGGAQTGFNYLSRKNANGDQMTLSGVDLVAKWRDGGVLKFLLQSEVWHRALKPNAGEEDRAVGAYLLPQFGFNPNLQIGLVIDYYSVLTLKDITGRSINNTQQRLSPTITYKASEFSSLRLAYEWALDTQDSLPDKKEQSLLTQATFVIGAHPAHDF